MWISVLAIIQSTAAPPAAHQSGAFKSARVNESSGVAVSRKHRGLLWTHNDSGDGPYVYATDTTGADRGALRVPDAEAVDWEDMALGPCPRAAGDCLYLADTGDNSERRTTVTVYAVSEPEPPSGPADTSRLTMKPATLHLRYPDGPADVEAVYVAPDGVLYLVSKGRSRGVRLYRVPRTSWTADTLVTAEKLEDVATIVPDRVIGRLVTGAAISPNGTRVVVRTYTELYQFEMGKDGRLSPAGNCPLGPLEEQGEAVDFLDASTLVLTSEAGRRPPGSIYIVRCP